MGGPLEDPDEGLTDDLPLLLGVRHALEAVQEVPGGVDHDQAHAHVLPERLLDALPLAGPEEPGIDEDAGELVADCPVNQGGGHRRIHASRQPADHGGIAHHVPDLLDGLLDERPGRPVRITPADIEEEVRDDLPSSRRVGHLGMELDAEERPTLGPEGCHGKVRRRGHRDEARRGLIDVVAVGAPHDHVVVSAEAFEDPLGLVDPQVGPPVLPLPRHHRPTGSMGDELHPIADAEDGNVQLQDPGVESRAFLAVDRRGATRQHDPLGTPLPNPVRRKGGRVDLAVDVSFPDAPGDELGELRSVVQDEDSVVHRIPCSGWGAQGPATVTSSSGGRKPSKLQFAEEEVVQCLSAADQPSAVPLDQHLRRPGA